MATKKKTPEERFKESITKLFAKNFKKSKVRCRNCGNTWNCAYFYIKGGESKLECPKCKKRNSEIIG